MAHLRIIKIISKSLSHNGRAGNIVLTKTKKLVSLSICHPSSLNIDAFLSAGQTYHIYDQPTKPAINAYVHLTRYVRYIERYHNDNEMKPTDYIFPMLGRSGVLQPGSPILTDAVQEMLDWAVEGAGIAVRFKTHCFRQGGAQYCFMYAPIGKRWTLACIRWWGGWAPGEGVRLILSLFFTAPLTLSPDCHAATRAERHAHQVSIG